MPVQPVPTWRAGLWDIASCAHILLRSSEFGLSGFMRRLLTGYAICYNHRHHRWGHLFQNRYKSIVCDEDAYFRKLVRYIHLNPLRAKLVKSLAALDRYRWCGHSVLVGRVKKEVSAIRGRIAIGLVEKYGIALAEAARRVDVSTSAISKIMQRANK